MTITNDTGPVPVTTETISAAERARNADMIVGAYRLAEMGTKNPQALSRFNTAKNLLAAAVLDFDRAAAHFEEVVEAAVSHADQPNREHPSGTALGAKLDAGALLESRKQELIAALLDLTRGI